MPDTKESEPPNSPLFMVSSHQRWVYEDFKAALKDYDVVYDSGFILPRHDPRKVSGAWTPAEHALRLRLSGFPLNLETPGPYWLDTVPTELKQRGTITTKVSDASPAEGFWKVAEAKSDQHEARWRTEEESVTFLRALPEDSIVQYSDAFIDIMREERFFVNRNILHGTTYIEGAWAYYDDCIERPVMDDSYQFVADLLRVSAPQATSYVIDIATLKDGSRAVLEANPVWCSGAYSADLRIVAEMIVDSMSNVQQEWVPDALLMRNAVRKRSLH